MIPGKQPADQALTAEKSLKLLKQPYRKEINWMNQKM